LEVLIIVIKDIYRGLGLNIGGGKGPYQENAGSREASSKRKSVLATSLVFDGKSPDLEQNFSYYS